MATDTSKDIERTVKIRRCAAVVKGGRRFSFAAMVVVGDGNGKVGWGYGKANEVPPSVEKATKQAGRLFWVWYRNKAAEIIPTRVQICDYCLDRRDAAGEPACIASCPHGALRLATAESDSEATFLVGDHLIVHSTHWMREKA